MRAWLGAASAATQTDTFSPDAANEYGLTLLARNDGDPRKVETTQEKFIQELRELKSSKGLQFANNLATKRARFTTDAAKSRKDAAGGKPVNTVLGKVFSSPLIAHLCLSLLEYGTYFSGVPFLKWDRLADDLSMHDTTAVRPHQCPNFTH